MNRIEVWRASLDRSADEVEALYGLLDPSERIRSSRFKKDSDRRRFIVARGALRIMLADYTATRPEQVPISVQPGGKPSLGAEEDPVGLRFNLSHSGDVALFAFSSRAVGIDLQRAEAMGDMSRVVAHFFSPIESSAFESLVGNDRVRFFFRTWVRKEAYVKASGQGFALDPSKICVAGASTDRVTLYDDDGATRVDTTYTIIDISNFSDHFAALAFTANASPPAISFREWVPACPDLAGSLRA